VRSLPFIPFGRSCRRALCFGVLVALLSTVVVAFTPHEVRAATPWVDYRPPSDAEIVDHFRPPPKPWMAGNRGIDYGTSPGAQISASADGRVIFAGLVGGCTSCHA